MESADGNGDWNRLSQKGKRGKIWRDWLPFSFVRELTVRQWARFPCKQGVSLFFPLQRNSSILKRERIRSLSLLLSLIHWQVIGKISLLTAVKQPIQTIRSMLFDTTYKNLPWLKKTKNKTKPANCFLARDCLTLVYCPWKLTLRRNRFLPVWINDSGCQTHFWATYPVTYDVVGISQYYNNGYKNYANFETLF